MRGAYKTTRSHARAQASISQLPRGKKREAKIGSNALRSGQFTSGESKGGVIERVCPD